MPIIIYQLSLIAYQTFPHLAVATQDSQTSMHPESQLAKLIRSPSRIRPVPMQIEIDGRIIASQRLPSASFVPQGGRYHSKNENRLDAKRVGRRPRKNGTGARLYSRDRGTNITYDERTLSENVVEWLLRARHARLISDGSYASIITTILARRGAKTSRPLFGAFARLFP